MSKILFIFWTFFEVTYEPTIFFPLITIKIPQYFYDLICPAVNYLRCCCEISLCLNAHASH